MMKKHFALILSLFLCLNVLAQLRLNYGRFDSITFINQSDTLELSTCGGLNAPMFSEIDLNGDGIQDLFVYDRHGQQIRTFINNGTANKTDYRFAPEYIQYFPPVHHIALLRDFNKDGKADLFSEVPVGNALMVWKNTGTTGKPAFTRLYFYHSFQGVVGEITSDYGASFLSPHVRPGDIPGLEDIDHDGDLDLLHFAQNGSMVKYHKNMSLELTGGYDTLAFELVTECWGKFAESPVSNSITFGYNCKGNSGEAQTGNSRHKGSNMLPIDLDGDLDKDLVLSDISYPTVGALNNTGTVGNALMTSWDSLFPGYDVSIQLKSFPGVFYLDINNDGKKELVASPQDPNDGVVEDHIWMYDNTGSTNNPQFSLNTKNFLVSRMVDVGTAAHPVFFDVDNDGLLDLLIGNEGLNNLTGAKEASLTYYKNQGDSSYPVFKYVTGDYAGLKSQNMQGIHPTVGDLDGDGDKDMILGHLDGKLYYYENTATTGSATFQQTSIQGLASVDVGEYSAPQLIDLNEDNLPDLLIGERNGTLNFLPNTGTQSNPIYADSTMVENFGGVKHQHAHFNTGYTAPYAIKMDTAGKQHTTLPAKWYIFLGTEMGFTYVYHNIDSNLNGNFTLLDSFYTASYKPSIAGGDLNNDSIVDLVYGESAGGISFLVKGSGFHTPLPPNDTDSVGVNSIAQLPAPEVRVYPNPANEAVTVHFGTSAHSNGIIRLLDSQGRTIFREKVPVSADRARIDVQGLAPGLYFIRIESDKNITTEKLVVR